MGIKKLSLGVTVVLIAGLVEVFAVGASASVRHTSVSASRPEVTQAAAFDVSPAVRDLSTAPATATPSTTDETEIPSDRGRVVNNGTYAGDGARQDSSRNDGLSPLLTFEGLSNNDNFLSPFGRRVTPPDPVGAVGPNHYVEMVNLVFAVYDKQGTRLAGPILLGDLWKGFEVTNCGRNAGDPIVLYDRRADRWILTQFTSGTAPYYNCIAVSTTSNPTGPYYRYAYSWGEWFPDYPKYSVWSNAYLLTSRDFGPGDDDYGISVASLERQKMISGDPSARMVRFFLDSQVVPTYLMGDGLLPADVDGWSQPAAGAPAPIVGTMNATGQYDAPFDALNIFELSVDWQSPGNASFDLVSQLPVAQFTSKFPCTDTITINPPPVPPAPPATNSQTRSCIPQPGTTRKIDVLSYRQRPTFRLAYRNFEGFETMVTNQSVQATPGMAGVRWYEIRRSTGRYSVFQQGTYAPADGVHRWMGSIAMDKKGNIGLGYSVSNGVDVYPGIRFTGRLQGDPLGKMTLGEGVIIDGTGSQLTANSRWGDYTSLNIDPTDDCTFWYVNEYIQTTAITPWQTRIGSFRLPGCAGE